MPDPIKWRFYVKQYTADEINKIPQNIHQNIDFGACMKANLIPVLIPNLSFGRIVNWGGKTYEVGFEIQESVASMKNLLLSNTFDIPVLSKDEAETALNAIATPVPPVYLSGQLDNMLNGTLLPPFYETPKYPSSCIVGVVGQSGNFVWQQAETTMPIVQAYPQRQTCGFKKTN